MNAQSDALPLNLVATFTEQVSDDEIGALLAPLLVLLYDMDQKCARKEPADGEETHAG